MSKSANLLTRTVSKGVDLILVFAIMEALPRAGWLAGILYVLISDGLTGGQSLGKRLTGLRVVTVDEQGVERICDMKASIMRNAALALGLFLFRLPLMGWLLFIALLGFEFVTLMGSSEGKRFGDELAGTAVREVQINKDGREDIV